MNFIDAYRVGNSIILWLKTKGQNIRLERKFRTSIYLDTSAEQFLTQHNIDHFLVEMRTYLRTWKKVYEVPLSVSKYTSFIRWIEEKNKHSLFLYNADVPPEQQFMYEHNLRPGCSVKIRGNKLIKIPGSEVSLTKANISLKLTQKEITSLIINKQLIQGSEVDILKTFLQTFNDPDIILMDYAFSHLPLLAEKLQQYNLPVPFHRWDKIPITYKGGKSFFSYGSVRYKDFAIRLRGRLLVDTTSTVGSECDVDGIMELCRLTGARFQQVASRSFGAAFQHSLTRLMYQQKILIPYKEKPVDIPLSMIDLLKGDRGGHTFDAQVGFHTDVAEIDFTSMFPWLIYNKNISAETILTQHPPLADVPDLPFKISHKYKGLVAQAIKPLLDARMYYKNNPTPLHKRRAAALKWVLVTAYGYLRFREFKLGIASSHMAICAYARDIIIQSARLAEQRGFTVEHGIVDSLYIKKKNIQQQEVLEFCKELEQLVGIPISFEGIFKWIVFLPSINDPYRPLPATYYGVFRDGKIKARGIAVRQRKTPLLIKQFQQEVLEETAECDSKRQIVEKLPRFCRLLRNYAKLDNVSKKLLLHNIRISKDSYKHNLPQKKIITKLKRRKTKVLPGMTIKYFIATNDRALLPDEQGKPDLQYYKKLLVRSLFMILQPFGISKNKIIDLSGIERQTKLLEFHPARLIPHYYIPLTRLYKSNKGLSERQLKKRLEKVGWEVWRGGSIHMLRKQELFPNVRRKYTRLILLLHHYHPHHAEFLEYLCHIHKGMPDFICFRKGEFKFVECKFKNESVSKRQRKCFERLQKQGFRVEVHKLVDFPTKVRRAEINVVTGNKRIMEAQMGLRVY